VFEERRWRRGQHEPTLRPKPEKIASQEFEIGASSLQARKQAVKGGRKARRAKVKICFMR
jgi:hypothetical protein